MNTAFLVGGESSAATLSGVLSAKFQVKKLPAAMDAFLEAVRKSNPDIVIAVLTEDFDDILFPLILSECPDTPLIAIGSPENESALSKEGYLSSEWVRFLYLPVNAAEAAKCANEFMALKNHDKEAERRRHGGSSSSREKSAFEDASPIKKGASLGETRGGIYSGPSGRNRPNVLLVDDNPSVLRAMQPILSRKYEVSFATSGTQAILSIAQKKPDIILLDYEMPDVDGLMTLRMIRAESSTKDIPVIFLTGIADFEHVIDALDLRPQGYLLKPCTEERLFSEIETVLIKGVR